MFLDMEKDKKIIDRHVRKKTEERSQVAHDTSYHPLAFILQRVNKRQTPRCGRAQLTGASGGGEGGGQVSIAELLL